MLKNQYVYFSVDKYGIINSVWLLKRDWVNRTRQANIQNDFLSRHVSTVVMLNCLQKTCGLNGGSIKRLPLSLYTLQVFAYILHTMLRDSLPLSI